MGALTEKVIDTILGVRESFELPEKLTALLSDIEKREAVFARFLEIEPDLSFDWFTDYFQENCSNHKKMMQEFTPRELARLLPELLGDFCSCLDVCAGTGGLTVAAWNKNHGARFVVEELSRQVFPLLLFNLAIRNVEGLAINRDTLTGELFGAYRLTRGESFSAIAQTDDIAFDPVDVCVTNPPYSLKWQNDPKDGDPRFAGFGYPPNDKADYGFVLHGFHHLNATGRLAAILPRGTLFRGNREREIRKNLIDGGHLAGVIDVPRDLFLNTSIAVSLLLLRRESGSEPVVFIDGSQEYEKGEKQNRLTEKEVEKISSTYNKRLAIERYSRLVPAEEISGEDHDYNLAPGRYIDTYIKPPTPDITQICAEMVKGEIKRRRLNRAMYDEILTAMPTFASCGIPEKDLEAIKKAWAFMAGVNYEPEREPVAVAEETSPRAS